MNPERFRRLKDLAFEVADLPAEAQQARLDVACRGDPELRHEVESMLAHDRGTHEVLKRDALLGWALNDSSPAEPPMRRSPPGSSSSRLAGQTVSHYEILGLIGEGGMGQVYRARDKRLGREVAFKVVSPAVSTDAERIRRFEQEARAAGALNHPNVVALYDIGMHEGVPFVVMELLEGESLRQRLNRGPLPAGKAIEYAAQCARGLAAAHEKGIIHRDIKPENLFVTKHTGVKIIDFGVAKLIRTDLIARPGKSAADSLTGTGAIIGTSGYMSPEQAHGHSADARSDIFALGATMYEMLTGHRAFEKGSLIETLHAIVSEDPAPMSASGREIPAGLEAIVRHCLEKNPAERFQSARDLAFDLEAINGTTFRTMASTAPKGASVKIRRRFGYGAAFLAGVLLVAAGAIMMIKQAHVTDASHLEFTRLTAQRGLIENARFSADGRSVFYTALWDGRPPETFETRPGYPSSRSLGLPQTSLLSVSSDGRMAVKIGAVTDRDCYGCCTLAEVPISGGTPRKVLDNIQSADWSRDGSTLAASHQVEGEVQLEMPLGRVLYKTAKTLLDVRISPDQEYIAFTEHPVFYDSRAAVVIVDRNGRVRARSPEWNFAHGLAWSANGREVWYCSCQNTASSELRAITTGGKERVIARFGGFWTVRDVGQNGQALLLATNYRIGIRGRRNEHDEERELGWFDASRATDISADGRVLLFEEQGVFGGPLCSVCLRNMDGSDPVKLGEGYAGSLSPDGKWALSILHASPQRLVLLPTGTGDPVWLPRGTVENYYEASWLPDGKSVIFAGSEPGHAQRSFIQDLQGGLPLAITPESVAGSRVSPDGSLVAAVTADRRLFICPTDGDSATFVTRLLPLEEVLQWAADGRAIFVGSYGTSARVARIDITTGQRTPWKTIAAPDSAAVLALKVALTPDGQGYAFTYLRIPCDLYVVDGLK